MLQLSTKKIIIGLIILGVLISLFVLASQTKQTGRDYFEELGLTLSLPLFTFLIALMDGFNPCTMWVLSFLLMLLISVSHSRKRIFVIGFTFVGVVFIIYFIFMVFWFNVLLYIGFLEWIAKFIGIVAVVAGILFCKEYFFFRKGPSLLLQEKHKGILVKKMERMKDIIKTGSMPALIISSIILAGFASLFELPCTAFFPVIYTKVLVNNLFPQLSGLSLQEIFTSLSFSQTFFGYFYMLLYNLIYITPLAIIIFAFGYFLKGKKIAKQQMQAIKLIGGVIMIALGIILLVNPELLMMM